MAAKIGEIREEGFEALVVVPHDAARVKAWEDRAGGPYPVLADPGFVASCAYGVAFQMRIHVDTSNTPGVFVIDKKGVLRWAHRGEGPKNWADRPDLALVQGEVRKAAK